MRIARPYVPLRDRILDLSFIIMLLACAVIISLYAYNQQQEHLSIDQRIQASRQSYHESVARESTTWDSAAPTEPYNLIYPSRTGAFDIHKTAQEPRPVRQRFLDLMEEYNNSDIVGYLQIENTSIDYIVVQSEDNDYYLSRDIYKNNSSPGWIFVDFRNNMVTGDDPSVIIYGHNMKRDIMFHAIRYFKDYSFYKDHPTIIFDSLYEDGVWEIFSFFITSVDFYYIQTDFADKHEFYQLALEIKSRSMYETGINVSSDDRILLLSTCAGGAPDTRCVLAARLVNTTAPHRFRLSANQADQIR